MNNQERSRRAELGLNEDDPLPDTAMAAPPAPAVGPLPMGKSDPRGPFGAKSLGAGFNAFSGNVYFYWFEYMREYANYSSAIRNNNQQSFRTMREFDIHSDEEFSIWWDRKGEDLFYDLYEDESHAVEVGPKTNKRDLGDGLLVYLPIDGNIADMLNEIEQMFKAKRQSLQSRYPELFRRYSLHQNRYTIYILHNKLEIYKAVMARQDDLQDKKIRLYDIFFEIADRLIISKGFRNVSPDAASRTMSESFDLACRLLYHVGEGRFPDYSLPPQRYDPRQE